MNEVSEKPKKRKVLSLRLEKSPKLKVDFPSRFVESSQGVIMVWHEGGDMPKRVYRPDEVHLACQHARQLVRETGERFHVMRSWRAFEPKGE